MSHVKNNVAMDHVIFTLGIQVDTRPVSTD